MSLSAACRIFGISRQAVYQQESRYAGKQLTLFQVRTMVRAQRMSMPRIGTRKLYYLLKHELISKGIKMGRDGLFGCLRSEHMLIKPLKNYTKTTWSRHWLYKHPNLMKTTTVDKAEQLWVSDITYIRTQAQSCYLSLITDAYSRRIVGYYVSPDLRTEGVMEALKMAVADRVYRHPLVHHSDRGVQYCAEPYQQILKDNGIRCSMTDGYDCYQNALAERMNGIIKNEFLVQEAADIEQLKKMVRQSVDTYNERRPHLSLNMNTPNKIHKEKSLPGSATKDYC